MKSIQDNYPFFEPNQVLSNIHLNQGFDYLEEQERLTRANLIGIGIACGLEIRLDKTASRTIIHLTKGCGITSEGYLIVEPTDLALVSWRKYILPSDLTYQPFKTGLEKDAPQYDLWEVFPDGEPNAMSLETLEGFEKKAVLLFLELNKEGLRNCSPNNCDDKGAEVTATVRRLLVEVADLNKIIAKANSLESNITPGDLESPLAARLKLPDLRLPRFDIPNTSPVTSHQLLAAFLTVFQTAKLVHATEQALTAAYNAFQPVVREKYPNNPFGNFTTKFGFLDDAPKTPQQVLFLQYYYDFFDDLFRAYDEFRWKGAELMCVCCPPEGLFPRHLMLGVLTPSAVANPNLYRHHFFASAAIGGCEEHTKELRQLFQRMVGIIAQFTDEPQLSTPLPNPDITDAQIRITPSTLGDKLLSEKAIPYYYHQTGDPPLFKLWHAERTRRNKAHHNLSYRSDEYTPEAPSFVKNALRYDLEPYSFLRIEGHLGKSYQGVLNTLLAMKAQFRLPIEIIALRTGAFDENMAVDVSKEQCTFQDLETVYDALREEFFCTLCAGVQYLYDTAIKGSDLTGGIPQLLLLKRCAPSYRYTKGTVGAWYEENLKALESGPYIEVNQNKIDTEAFYNILRLLFMRTSNLSAKSAVPVVVVAIYYLAKPAEVLPERLSALNLTDFENRYQDLMALLRFFRSDASTDIPDDLKQFIRQEEVRDQFDKVLSACKLDPISAVHDEYVRRLREVKQKQFLSFFLQKNPGIQHKAGVPLGGTFIVAYHDEPPPLKRDVDIDELRADTSPTPMVFSKAPIDKIAIAKALQRIGAKPEFAVDQDVRFVLSALTGQAPDPSKTPPPGTVVNEIIDATVNKFDNGTVIADFYLPYVCCSDCSPVKFELPKNRPTFSVERSCTDSDTNSAEVTVTPKGGVEPYYYRLDDVGDFISLTGKPVLTAGKHTLVIQDNEGTESYPKDVIVPPALTLGLPLLTDDRGSNTYEVSFDISGGTPPYTADSGTIEGTRFTRDAVRSGETLTVKIIDGEGCEVSKSFEHTIPPCDLPCDGKARRCGYLFWLPEPDRERPYKSFNREVPAFKFEFPKSGQTVDLHEEVQQVIQAIAEDLNTNFQQVVQTWIKRINSLIEKKTGSEDWLRLAYSRSPDGRMGTLWIEYFECLSFDFHIRTFFGRPEEPESLDMHYTPEGTQIQNREIKIPAFDCIEIDKCDPRRPEVRRCNHVRMDVSIEKSLDARQLTLRVDASGSDIPATFLWEVQDGIPVFSNEKKSVFTFTNNDRRTKKIWLTAFTEKGCTVTAADEINVDG